MQGAPVWDKDFGKMQIKLTFGEGCSPALFGQAIIVNWDHEGDSFITALDKRTGNELWRTPRDEKTSWATPLVVTVDGKPQVITAATGKIRSYDLASGHLCGNAPAWGQRHSEPVRCRWSGVHHDRLSRERLLAIRLGQTAIFRTARRLCGNTVKTRRMFLRRYWLTASSIFLK